MNAPKPQTAQYAYARGWFVVAMAEDIGPEAVLPLRYFGQDFVAFRGQDGDVRLLDAYCPHLGAHMGVGGKVVENSIQCPFHHWRFGGDGKCVDVPYAKQIPKKACVRSWPVRERNGLVFVWHDPEGLAPEWEIPVIEELGTPEWTNWDHKRLHIATQPREVVENLADKGHFPRVHGTEVEVFENEFDGHIAVQKNAGVAYPRGGGVDRFELSATYYGPGYMITRMKSVLPNILLLAHTPIDEGSLHLWFGAALKKVGDRAKMAEFTAQYVKNLQIGFEEDIAIWENKLWRDRPTLCDGDGPIGRLRKWYQHFYRPREADGEQAQAAAPPAE